MIFLRFNPDGFVGDDGSNVPSPWTINKLGLCRINSKREAAWNARLETLAAHVQYWLDEANKSDQTVQVIQLYYDGHTL
jgi:hypothetical protein